MPINDADGGSHPSLKPLKVFVHLGYGYAADEHFALYHAGNVPDLVPYGFHHAEAMECEMRYSHDHPEGLTTSLIRRGLGKVLGFDLIHAYRNRGALFSADIVWTMEERQFLAVLALPELLRRLRRPRVIAQSVWLFNHWDNYSKLRRAIVKRLLMKADQLTVHSANYLGLASQIVPAVKIRLLLFGISIDSFPFREGVSGPVHQPIRILALGNDKTRDWTTLLSAFGNDDRFDLVVVSGQVPESNLRRYRNLKLPRNPSTEDFRAFYRWADFTVVPMVPNLYSGITVALESTSMGVPVVCSRTGGVPTYFTADEILYVEPEDESGLRNAVLDCSDAERAARLSLAQARFVREDYSSLGMARRYVELSQELMRQESLIHGGIGTTSKFPGAGFDSESSPP